MTLAKKRKMNLRIFDAAAGGEGASTGAQGAGNATGDTTNDTNTQVSTTGDKNSNTDSHAAGATTSNAEKTYEERKAEFDKRIRGEDKEFYDQHVNSIIGKRFKDFKTLENSMNQLQPLLSALAEDLGLENTSDTEAIVKAYLNDEKRLVDRAAKSGLSPEQQKLFDALKSENALLTSQQNMQAREQERQALIAKWNREAQDIIDNLDSDFKLEEAFQNDEFYRMVTSLNVPLKMAYFAAFEDRYNSIISQKAEKKVTDNIKARGQRPPENGSTQATASSEVNISKLTAKERAEYAKRAQRGEVIDFKTRF